MRNFIIVFLSLFSSLLHAQIDMVAFGSRAAVVTNMYNPAIPLEGELSFNLPGLNSYSFTGLTPFSATEMVTRQDGWNYLDIGKTIENLKNKNVIALKADTDPFYFSTYSKSKKGFISAGYGHYAELTGEFSKNLLTYLGNGNADFIDEEVNFENENIGFLHYHKVHLGYARFINPKLNIGARINVYGGFNNFEMKSFSAKIFTDGSSFPAYATDASAVFEGRMGGMIAQQFDGGDTYSFSGDHAMGLGYGVGMDLGFQYQLRKNFKISGSAKNIGGAINWKEQFGRKISMTGDGQISFEGITANLNSENVSADVDSQFKELEDELKRDFNLSRVMGRYKTQIGNAFLFSAHYKTNNNKHELIGMYHARDRFGSMYQQAGLTYHFSPFKWIQLSGGYSWMEEEPVNLGAGATLTLGFFQFNAFTNHVPEIFNIGNGGQVSARVGVNVVWQFAKEEEAPKTEIIETPVGQSRVTKQYFK